MSGVVALCCTLVTAAPPRPLSPPVSPDRVVALSALSHFELPPSMKSPHASLFPLQASKDSWFGQDKMKHLVTSFAATTMGYAGLRTTGVDHRSAALLAVAGAGTLGVLKEAYDRAHARPFSFRDLAWDALGVAIGAALVDRTR